MKLSAICQKKNRLKDLVEFTNCIVKSKKTRFYRINLEAILSILNLIKDLLYESDIEWELYQIGKFLEQFTHTDELFKLYKIIDQNLKYFFHIYVLNRVERIGLENFFGIMKQEMYYGEVYYSYDDLNEAINNYIEYYNRQRIKEKLGWMSPIEYRLSLLVA